jgi:hypothetical protein
MSMNDVDNIPARLRGEFDRLGLPLAHASRAAGENSPQRLKDVVSGKQRCPVDLLARLEPLGVDIFYVVTGKRGGEREQAPTELLPSALDMPRLVDAVETVEAGLQAAHSEMQPRPKAELVALVYQALEEEEAPAKLLRLVKEVIATAQQQYEGTT